MTFFQQLKIGDQTGFSITTNGTWPGAFVNLLHPTMTNEHTGDPLAEAQGFPAVSVPLMASEPNRWYNLISQTSSRDRQSGCFSITNQASLNDIQWIGLRLQESMVFTFYHQIYVMYNIAICKGFLQIFSFPILNIIWNRFMVRRSPKKNPALQTPKHTAGLLPAPFAKLTLGGNRLRQLVLPLLATRDRDLGGWFSIVFSINFSSFFHQSQLFCGGNSMGCDPEPSTEYPSGGLLPNCSSNPFFLVIPHPRYCPKNLKKLSPKRDGILLESSLSCSGPIAPLDSPATWSLIPPRFHPLARERSNMVAWSASERFHGETNHLNHHENPWKSVAIPPKQIHTNPCVRMFSSMWFARNPNWSAFSHGNPRSHILDDRSSLGLLFRSVSESRFRTVWGSKNHDST